MMSLSMQAPFTQLYQLQIGNKLFTDQQLKISANNPKTTRNSSTTEQYLMVGIQSNGKSKIKTSLCKKWSETGNCPYGYKCQFAHGIAQLRCYLGETSYKTKECNAFFKKGCCPYGGRCNFSHRQFKNGVGDFEMNNIKQRHSQVAMLYRQIIQQGKLARIKRGRLADILKNYGELNDQKSVSSTEESKSQNLSQSKIDVSTCEINCELSQQNNTSFYNYDQNIIYGNIAQGNSSATNEDASNVKQKNYLYSSDVQVQLDKMENDGQKSHISICWG